MAENAFRHTVKQLNMNDRSVNTAALLRLQGVSKSFPGRDAPLQVLDAIDLVVAEAASCAIVGPSGSGKTTLLGLCAGLDRADSGTIFLAGQPLHALSEDALAALRATTVGFVFQNFQLLPSLTALENVMVPLEIQGIRNPRAKARETLARVGLSARLEHYPNQLSGGEQQRVALARAFVHQPRILFADEPTGNLDAETSAPIVELLFKLNTEFGTTLVLVTHDDELAAQTGRVIRMRGGRITSGGSDV
jgi:putative ABC transport system ATP-binding protein